MKYAKILLSIIFIFAFIGGVVAFKANKRTGLYNCTTTIGTYGTSFVRARTSTVGVQGWCRTSTAATTVTCFQTRWITDL